MGLIAVGAPETHLNTSGPLTTFTITELPPGIQEGDGIGVLILDVCGSDTDDFTFITPPSDKYITGNGSGGASNTTKWIGEGAFTSPGFSEWFARGYYGGRYAAADFPQAWVCGGSVGNSITRHCIVTQVFSYDPGSLRAASENPGTSPFDPGGVLSDVLLLFGDYRGDMPVSNVLGGWTALAGAGDGPGEELGFRLAQINDISVSTANPTFVGYTSPRYRMSLASTAPPQFDDAFFDGNIWRTAISRGATVTGSGNQIWSYDLTARVGGPTLWGFGSAYPPTRDGDAWVASVNQSNGGSSGPGVWRGAATNEGTASGVWQHIAMIYNDGTGTVTIYVDGVEVAQNRTGPTGTRNSSSLGALNIGGVDGTGVSRPMNSWRGRLARISFHASALSAVRIAAHAAAADPATYDAAVLVDTPAGFWKMNEATGSLVDSSGNNRSATPTGTPNYQVEDPWGGDDAIALDGATSWFTTASLSVWNATSFTIEGWFFAEADPAPNLPPTAVLTPLQLAMPEWWYLGAQDSTDADGTVASASIDFGDGSPVWTGDPNGGPYHEYAAPGTYTVTLTVTDNDGATDTDTANVVVTAITEPTTLVPACDAAAVYLTGPPNEGGEAGEVWPAPGPGAVWGATVASVPSPTGTEFTVTVSVLSNTLRDTFTFVGFGANGIFPLPGNSLPGFTPPEFFSAENVSLGAQSNMGIQPASLTTPGDGSFTVSRFNGFPVGASFEVVFTVEQAVIATDDYHGVLASLSGEDYVNPNLWLGYVLADRTGCVNLPPTAEIATSTMSGVAPLTINFDGTLSSDPEDGTVASYAWDFGDSTTSTSAVPLPKTYSTPGTYTVTLTVTDSDGATDTDTVLITVASPADPVASFTRTPASGVAPLLVSFNAGASDDPDGTIVSYSWNFGDGSPSGSGVNPSHTYTAQGTYTVTLTVTDNSGATDTTTRTVTVVGAIGTPTAVAAATPSSGFRPLEVDFSSAGSSDPNGAIISYSWNFGDGTSSSFANPTHTYTVAGTYTVILTVQDEEGATDTATVEVVVAPIGLPPVASASASPISGNAALAVSFNSGGSSDPDGTIVSYAWDFGDGNILNFGNANFSYLPNPSHTYAAAGIYTATLTVTDNDGNIATDTVTITVNRANGDPFDPENPDDPGDDGEPGGGGGSSGGSGGSGGGGAPGTIGDGGTGNLFGDSCTLAWAYISTFSFYPSSAPADFTTTWEHSYVADGVRFEVTFTALSEITVERAYIGGVSISADAGLPGPEPTYSTILSGLGVDGEVVSSSGVTLVPSTIDGLFAPTISGGVIPDGATFTIAITAPDIYAIAYASAGLADDNGIALPNRFSMAYVATDCCPPQPIYTSVDFGALEPGSSVHFETRVTLRDAEVGGSSIFGSLTGSYETALEADLWVAVLGVPISGGPAVVFDTELAVNIGPFEWQLEIDATVPIGLWSNVYAIAYAPGVTTAAVL